MEVVRSAKTDPVHPNIELVPLQVRRYLKANTLSDSHPLVQAYSWFKSVRGIGKSFAAFETAHANLETVWRQYAPGT